MPTGQGDPVVVVHEPGRVPDDAAVAALLAALCDRYDAVAVTTTPVTDTLKVVAGNNVVVGTADREHHRFVAAPFAARLSLLPRTGLPATVTGALTELGVRARLLPAGVSEA